MSEWQWKHPLVANLPILAFASFTPSLLWYSLSLGGSELPVTLRSERTYSQSFVSCCFYINSCLLKWDASLIKAQPLELIYRYKLGHSEDRLATYSFSETAVVGYLLWTSQPQALDKVCRVRQEYLPLKPTSDASGKWQPSCHDYPRQYIFSWEAASVVSRIQSWVRLGFTPTEPVQCILALWRLASKGKPPACPPCHADCQSRATIAHIILGTFGAFLTNISWRDTPYLTLEFLFNNP